MEPESILRGIGEQLYHEGVRMDFRVDFVNFKYEAKFYLNKNYEKVVMK